MDEWRSAIWITGATTRASLKISKIESRYSSVSRMGFFQSLTRLRNDTAAKRIKWQRSQHKKRWSIGGKKKWKTRFGWEAELQTRLSRLVNKTKIWEFNFVLPCTRLEWRLSLGRYWKRRSCVRKFEWYGFSPFPGIRNISLLFLSD